MAGHLFYQMFTSGQVNGNQHVDEIKITVIDRSGWTEAFYLCKGRCKYGWPTLEADKMQADSWVLWGIFIRVDLLRIIKMALWESTFLFILCNAMKNTG